jgi:hypothetical protein
VDLEEDMMARIPNVTNTERIMTAEYRFEIGPSHSDPPLPDAVHAFLCQLWSDAKLPGGNGCVVKVVLRASTKERT